MHKICLNMIVKNEALVIERCLDSVKSLIDYWVIVDTGSTDGTQKVITDYLKDIPGELHERKWVDFAYNRNEVLELSEGKSEYILIIDADDRLVFSDEFVLPELRADLYTIMQVEGTGLTYREHATYLLLRNDGSFVWEGKLHERLRSKGDKPKSAEKLPHVFNEYINDGARSKDPNKCENDIIVLKQSIKESFNARDFFYLARTFFSIRKFDDSMLYFLQRSQMRGDPMEVYHSLLYIGIIQLRSGYSSEYFLKSFMKAYLYRPSRVEAIYEIIRYYTESENYLSAYCLSKMAISIPATTDTLFVEAWVHDWGITLYFAISSYYIGSFNEAKVALEYLLSNSNFPPSLVNEFDLRNKLTKVYQSSVAM